MHIGINLLQWLLYHYFAFYAAFKYTVLSSKKKFHPFFAILINLDQEISNTSNQLYWKIFKILLKHIDKSFGLSILTIVKGLFVSPSQPYSLI